MAQNDKPTPKEWSRRQKAKRLVQLRADVQDVSRRVWELFYGRSLEAAPGMAEEWERKANEALELLTWTAKDIETLIGECCGRRSE